MARYVGRPVKRWEDSRAGFAKDRGFSWGSWAPRRGEWGKLEDDYAALRKSGEAGERKKTWAGGGKVSVSTRSLSVGF